MLKLPDDEFVSLELIHDRGHARVDSTGLSSPRMPCTDAPSSPCYVSEYSTQPEPTSPRPITEGVPEKSS